MRDSDASFEIEFHKEPDNIDETVYHVVNFIQTRRRNSCVNHAEKRLKKMQGGQASSTTALVQMKKQMKWTKRKAVCLEYQQR